MSYIETIDATTLGERLRVARSNAGVTQEDAAKKLGLSRATLVAVEQGQRKVRNEELPLFAECYKVSVNDLLRPSAVHVGLEAKFRRGEQRGRLRGSEEEVAALLNRLATAAVELETLLGHRQELHQPPEKAISPGPLKTQAEDLALELRHRLGLGLAPIADLVSVAELELGVRIFFRPLEGHISGVFGYDPAVGPCMLINSKHPRERQILTIAHEIGHYMCARNSPDVVRDKESESTREERFVNLFAVAFLMPAAAVRNRFRDFIGSAGTFTPRSLILLAHTFGVSFEAMARRLEGLRLLKQGTFDSIRDRGFAVEEAKRTLGITGAPALASPPRLTLLAVEAHRRGLLSEGQLSNMLSLDRVQLREQLDSFGGDELDDEIAVKTKP